MRNVLSRFGIKQSDKLRFVLPAILSFFMLFTSGICHAKEVEMFLDGDPRYPLVYAVNRFRHYLDLDTCALISGDADNFEIYAEYVAPKSQADDHRYTCSFRKNEESGGKLQVWNTRYDKGWRSFPDPKDEATIEKILDEEGRINYGLPDYSMFKCIYQRLFGESYEDDWDDEALKRTVMILPREEEPGRHHYLWDDGNYPCIWGRQGWAGHLDKSSVYAEMESPSQCVLRILILHMPMEHYNDIIAGSIHSERFLFDEEEEKMYVWSESFKDWLYLPPVGGGTLDNLKMVAGEAAFYLAYGEKFYGSAPKWDRLLKKYVDVFRETYYERLDGVDFGQ